ncbi:LCP family protein [Candidatus Uhrbacteria bacterium]|nr:LCP family protein [Candidatus Uhrbacteria bacterium]
MEEPRVNLLHKNTEEMYGRRPRPFFLRARVVGTVIALTLVIGIVFSATSKDASEEVGGSVFTTISRLVRSADKELSGETDDRVNILLLGIGGSGHDGPELTDTIIFGSFQPSTKQIGLLSIPRDLVIPLEGYGWRKINHVNAYGEEQKRESGPELAAQTIGEILGQPVHYWIKVDFKGFETFIDAIGGIDVDVARAFTDPAYPLEDEEGTITTLHFETGPQQMDGKTALQFVRSRHGDNGEGSDFARAARQQLVLVAVKKKLLSASVLLNPARLTRLVGTLRENMRTNLSSWEILRLARMEDLFTGPSINHIVLDTRPGSPLYETTAGGAYVILPRHQNWDRIQDIAKNLFDASEADLVSREAAPRGITLDIQNGTDIPSLAATVGNLLREEGYTVADVGNAEINGVKETIIYDRSYGAYPAELLALADYLNARISQSAGGWLVSQEIVPDELTIRPIDVASAGPPVDFLVILGESTVDRLSLRP